MNFVKYMVVLFSDSEGDWTVYVSNDPLTDRENIVARLEAGRPELHCLLVAAMLEAMKLKWLLA